jgi:hypothetical protein
VRHQFVRVEKTLGVGHERCCAFGRIAAQGQNIFHAPTMNVFQNFVNLRPPRPHAGEMRHGFNADFVFDR